MASIPIVTQALLTVPVLAHRDRTVILQRDDSIGEPHAVLSRIAGGLAGIPFEAGHCVQ